MSEIQTPPPLRLQAYLDEAGEKGYLRNLIPSSDDKICLIAAIVIPAELHHRFYSALLEPFDKFKAARPPGDYRLHITDAFAAGDISWKEAAQQARADIFGIITDLEIPIIYDARRFRIARQSFTLVANLSNQAPIQKQSSVRVNSRPSAEKIEEDCMHGIALKLDAFAEDVGYDSVDLYTDQMDRPIAQLFQDAITASQTISIPKVRQVDGWNLATQTKVTGSIQMRITDVIGQTLDWLDAKRLGALKVLGKDDPLVFASDVVVNALHYHLSNLPVDAPLNAPSSVHGWELGHRVYGVSDDAFEDKI